MTFSDIIGFMIIGFTSGFILGGVYISSRLLRYWHDDAVKNGHAEWIADENGKAVWRWKEIL